MEQLDWSIEAFRAWLNAQPAARVIGTSDDCLDCPIVTWRRDLGEATAVAAETIVFLHNGDEYGAPGWVYHFVYGIDRRHVVLIGDGDEYDYIQEDVLPSECLTVLDELPL